MKHIIKSTFLIIIFAFNTNQVYAKLPEEINNKQDTELKKKMYQSECINIAEQGSPSAQFHVGLGYYEEKNYEQAIKWYRKSAEQGFMDAQHELFLLYYFGEGTKPIIKKQLNKELHSINRISQHMYYHGRGVTQDSSKALAWHLKAAKQGFTRSQIMLGLLYNDGQDLKEDYDKALYWFDIAAKSGDSEAQASLGYFYFERSKNNDDLLPKAWAWLSLAKDKGIPDLDSYLSEIKSDMTSNEIKAAEKLFYTLRSSY